MREGQTANTMETKSCDGKIEMTTGIAIWYRTELKTMVPETTLSTEEISGHKKCWWREGIGSKNDGKLQWRGRDDNKRHGGYGWDEVVTDRQQVRIIAEVGLVLKWWWWWWQEVWLTEVYLWSVGDIGYKLHDEVLTPLRAYYGLCVCVLRDGVLLCCCKCYSC